MNFYKVLLLPVLLLLISNNVLAGRLVRGAPNEIPGHFIVMLSENVDSINVTANHGLETGRRYTHTIHGFSAVIAEHKLQALVDDPDVILVEADKWIRIVEKPIVKKGKPSWAGGGDGSSTPPAESIPWGVTRVNGGIDGTNSGTAWVIDSGIDLDHPDLNVNTAYSACFLSNCRKGADDENGHGTHVAGTIAAIDNDRDVVGVAAGASVVAVKVLDKRGSGTVSGVLAGIDYVAANANSGDVANMSLGGGASQTLDSAVIALAESGVKVALAAGNESDAASNHSPARANHSNIYTVSAMDDSDVFAYFSNYGNPPIDYAAPGVRVLSLYKDGGTATLSGTSMAAPHVAGILLLGGVSSIDNVSGDPDAISDPIATH